MPTFYVNSDKGNDVNDGSDPTTNSWATLAHGLTQISANDTIVVIGVGSPLDATYAGTGIYGGGAATLTIPNVAMTIQGSGTVVITNDGTDPTVGAIWYADANTAGITFKDMTLRAAGTITRFLRWDGLGDCTLINVNADDNSNAVSEFLSFRDNRTGRDIVLDNVAITIDGGLGFIVNGANSFTFNNGSSLTCANSHTSLGSLLYGDIASITLDSATFTRGTGTTNNSLLSVKSGASELTSNTTLSITDVAVTCAGPTSKGLTFDRIVGSGGGGSVTVNNLTLVHTDNSAGLLLEFGLDGPESHADGSSVPLGPVTATNVVIDYQGASVGSHGILVGFGADNGTYSDFTVTNCDTGMVIKGKSNTFTRIKGNTPRPIYFKSGQNNVVEFCSFNAVSGESIGFEKQTANGLFTGARRIPSNNYIHDCILPTDGDNVWENRTSPAEDDIYGTRTARNAYMAGSSDWFTAATTIATFAAFKAAYVATLGGDATDAETDSIEIFSDPFANAAGGDFVPTAAAQDVLNAAGLNGIGAIPFSTRILRRHLSLHENRGGRGREKVRTRPLGT